MLKYSIWKKALFLFVALVMLFAVFSAPAVAGEKILRVAQFGDCTGFDPHKVAEIFSGRVHRQIYNCLVQPDENLVIQPDLAESWENPDDLTWVFKLRQGVFFHNGEEFTAEDVVYTFTRLFDPKTASPNVTFVREVDKVEAIDKYTVKITTKTPYAPLLVNLGLQALSILNQKAVEAAGEDYSRHPVGTGPFVFESWRPGDSVVVKRFDKYFKGPAKLDKIIFRTIPEDATRVIELESGGVDLCLDFPPQDFERIKADPRFVTFADPGTSTQYFGFNTSIEPFTDKRVRQALNYAVDIDAVIDALYFGLGVKNRGPLSEQIFGFDATLPEDPYPYNPEKAKALLTEAGYPNGFKTKLYATALPLTRSVSEYFQGFYAELGIEAEVVTLEWGAFLAETRDGVDGMFTMGYGGSGDADEPLSYLYESRNIGSSNRVCWSDPKFDEMLHQGRTTLDPEKRKAIYKEAQAYFNEEAPIVIMQSSELLAAGISTVEGFEIYPNQLFPLYNVSLAD